MERLEKVFRKYWGKRKSIRMVTIQLPKKIDIGVDVYSFIKEFTKGDVIF